MSFQWSKHAAHILSVFPAWQEQDGYALPLLSAAEQSLGVQLPAMLKAFYQSWGRRAELTGARETLLAPEQLELRAGGLIFAEENQAVYSWAMLYKELQMKNPPVYYADLTIEPEQLQWKPSHNQLSDFLDYLTYGHALSSGAPYLGVSKERCTEALKQQVKQTWRLIEIASVPMGLFPDPDWRWELYGGDGIVLDCSGKLWVGARTLEALDSISRHLHITWEYIAPGQRFSRRED